jgi:hypothetical protein
MSSGPASSRHRGRDNPGTGEAAGDLKVSVCAADVTQQLVRAGRLLDHLGPDPIALERTRVIESEGVTHLRYRVMRG